MVRASAEGTRFEHLGHTSFAVEREGVRILIDPIVARPDLDFRRAVYPEWFYGGLDGFDAVFISHGHNDHLHPPSMLGFPRDTPVYFLDEDLTTCSCDEDPRVLLPGLGFTDIRPFRPGDAVELDGGITVHVVPAQNSSEGEEQCAFLVETADAAVFDGVDIKDAPETRQALEPWRERVDLAFLPTGAALQWQGFWNQMDTVEALGFYEWLKPHRVATCGGSLSLSERPGPANLERYPKGLAEWLAAAGRALNNGALVHQRPPVIFAFREGELVHTRPLNLGSRYQPASRSKDVVRPVLTTYFTGYDPQLPTQRLGWVDSGLADWLDGLAPVSELVARSRDELTRLVARCQPDANQTPAGVLVPRTLRLLHGGGRHGLAAALSSLCPAVPENPAELETTFFGLAEALVENEPELGDEELHRLRQALWLDRRIFRLRLVHIELRRLASFEEAEADELRRQHVEGLRATIENRRPQLSPHHVRLDREMAGLLLDTHLDDGEVGVLCYASPSGVHTYRLSQVAALLLDLCDGRTFAQIVEDTARQLEMAPDQVSEALFTLLADLSKRSVLLIDWSS